MTASIQVLDGPAQVAQSAAATFARRAEAAIAEAGEFNIALSGGSTPKRLFQALAQAPFRDGLPWKCIHFFWGDERTVPPVHPDSNFGAAYETLLSKLDLPDANIHRIVAELDDPAAAAAHYEEELRRHFRLAEDGWPRFDLVFLGMGADGHTASLFPGNPVLEERKRLVAAPWIEPLATYRITLTCTVFNKAACIIFLVTGQDKADTLRAVVESSGPPRYPAQLIRPANGETLWLIDKAAARRLGPEVLGSAG